MSEDLEIEFLNEAQINPRKIKPVYVMFQDNVGALEKAAVLDGIYELRNIAEVPRPEIYNLGTWKSRNYTNGRNLNPYQSTDWYLEQGHNSSRNSHQLNAATMLNKLFDEPWRKPNLGGRDHYDVLVVREDMYEGNNNFLIGLAFPSIGTVMSTYRFKDLMADDKYDCIRTESTHEVGHVFGLVPEDRTTNIEDSLGKHCTNVCTMRQGLRVPIDWQEISKDRLNFGALCPQCGNDLKNYFRS
jgi:predicted Zn-dependent protease